jgi:Protein of unknown function (DUF1353)
VTITRRSFALSVSIGAVATAAGCASDRVVGDVAAADRWISDWKRSPEYKDVDGNFDLRRFKDPTYVLLSGIHWKPKKPGTMSLQRVSVPRGFVTDFASIPSVFWSILRPDGNYAFAATIHDYLYWVQDRSRSDADLIFRHIMDDLLIKDWQSTALFRAVDLFGERAWRSNARLKAAGENRLLCQLPESSPTLTWDEFKKRPGVFDECGPGFSS